MPALSVWAIRASLVHLFIGFTFGALLLANKGVPLHPALWALLPAHIELLLIGWMAQLAIGVGYWILPRFGGARGNVPLAWSAVVLLNLGVITAGAAALPALSPATALVGRALTASGVLAFALHAWPRIKPPGAMG